MNTNDMRLRLRECFVLFSALSAITLAACSQPAPSAMSAGEGDSSIIGGTDANGSEEFASTVVSVYNVESSGLCTASIVSDSLLVTAAHCVNGPASSLRIIFGTNIKDEKTRIVREPDSYKVSPLWPFRQDEPLNSGDIAMVKFSGGLPPGYRPAQILADASHLTNGTTVLLAGYGISNGVAHTGGGTLRYVEVQIQNNAFSESELLVAQNQGRGACHGDSGGPAYVRVNGQLMLWGVTNRGVNDPKNDCSVSAAYASVLYYREWLQQTAQELLGQSQAANRAPASAAGH